MRSEAARFFYFAEFGTSSTDVALTSHVVFIIFCLLDVVAAGTMDSGPWQRLLRSKGN
jgi:hypothetical protein